MILDNVISQENIVEPPPYLEVDIPNDVTPKGFVEIQLMFVGKNESLINSKKDRCKYKTFFEETLAFFVDDEEPFNIKEPIYQLLLRETFVVSNSSDKYDPLIFFDKYIKNVLFALGLSFESLFNRIQNLSLKADDIVESCGILLYELRILDRC